MSLNNSYIKKRNSSFTSYSKYNIQTNTSTFKTSTTSIKIAIRLRPLLPHEDFEYWVVDTSKNLISSKSDKKNYNNNPNQSFSYFKNDNKKFDLIPNNIQKINQLLLDNICPPQLFKFDKIFTKDITSEKIYLDICQDVIKNFIKGINGTIFVYGQTTSGKTYTMLGNMEYPGILPCALKNLFDLLEKEKNIKFKLYCSYIEIYNEIIHDLLGDSTGCKIIEDNNYGLIVPEAQKIYINTFQDGIKLKDIGEEKRQYKNTIINEYSSRSHTIFQLFLETSTQDEESNTIRNKYSLLNLVDLAGSERINNSENNKNNNETGYINKSLFALSNVINKLSENKNNYIPYRDSKLTRLLSVALGGGSLVTIICNISPSANNFFQTVSTLRFANRAKKIKLKPTINERIINKYNRNDEISDENKNKNEINENGKNIGYNIYNNNIYNIMNPNENDYFESENCNEKSYEIKYYKIFLKNKKLMEENHKLKATIEVLLENNFRINNEESFIDIEIEKIKKLNSKQNLTKEINASIDNNLKEIKNNYMAQLKSIQSKFLSKLKELQSTILQLYENSLLKYDRNEKNKKLFSEIDLNFDEPNNINEVKQMYEFKEKQLEQLMEKYKENTDFYFQNLMENNSNKYDEDTIYKEYNEKISELEKSYGNAQSILEKNFFEKLKFIINFNK